MNLNNINKFSAYKHDRENATGTHRPPAIQRTTYIILIAATFVVMALSGQDSKSPLIVSLFAITLIASFTCESRNIFHMMLMGSHYAFWAFPLIALTATGYNISIYPISICVYGLLLLLLITSGKPVNLYSGPETSETQINVRQFLFIMTTLVILLVMTSGKSFIYTIALAIVSSILCSRNKSLFHRFTTTSIVTIYVALYAAIYWSGFGRLIVFSPLIVLVIYNFGGYIHSLLLKLIVFFSMSFGSLIGSLIRSDARTLNEAFRISLTDSAVGPMVLLMRIHESYTPQLESIRGWLDQIMLFFFIGVPRDWWKEKPQGFGFQYTLDMLETYLIMAGHSVASTFAGEHIYYLGPIGAVFGITFSAALLGLTYLFMRSGILSYGFGSLALTMWIPTYYWGGMASFSARFSLSVVLLIVFFIMYRIYLNITKKNS